MSPKQKPIRKAPAIPKSRRMDVTRAEFGRVIDLLNERGQIINEIRRQVEKHSGDIDVQFKRIAQMQADLDQIKRMLARLNVA